MNLVHPPVFYWWNKKTTSLKRTLVTNAAILDYSVQFDDVHLEESAYCLETLFGAEQANSLERSAEEFPEHKPFESLDPYAMYVLKLNPQ